MSELEHSPVAMEQRARFNREEKEKAESKKQVWRERFGRAAGILALAVVVYIVAVATGAT